MAVPQKVKRYSVSKKGEGRSLLVGNDREIISRIGLPYHYTEEQSQQGLKLSFANDYTYTLRLAETLTLTDVRDKRSLNTFSVAECLRDWIAGTYRWKDEEILLKVDINTKKHMFVYTITPKVIYIRAARYACVDEGVVFSQNIRMFDNDGEFSMAFMQDDNSIAVEELGYDPAHFQHDRCSIPRSVEEGIYWSVKEVKEENEVIVLNGCGGDDYHWCRNDNSQVEAFA